MKKPGLISISLLLASVLLRPTGVPTAVAASVQCRTTLPLSGLVENTAFASFPCNDFNVPLDSNLSQVESEPANGAFDPHPQVSLTSVLSDESKGSVNQAIPKEVSYTLRIGSRSGDKVIFPIRISGPGLVSVSVTWSGKASNLAVYLDGPGRSYQSVAGRSPVSLSYNITKSDFSRGSSWSVRLVNSSGGSATGTVVINYRG